MCAVQISTKNVHNVWRRVYVRKMDTHKDSYACAVLDVWLVAWYSQLPIESNAILFVAWMRAHVRILCAVLYKCSYT